MPVIVDFWAPWCKPCDAIEPHLRAIAAENGARVRARAGEHRREPRRSGSLRRPLAADGDPLRRRRAAARPSTARIPDRASNGCWHTSQARTLPRAATLAAVATDVAAGWADLLEGEEIAYAGVEPSREPKLEPLPDDLDPRVASALVGTGVTALYRHQAEAWEAARRGENVVVTTGHGLREVARVQPPRARRDRARAEDARALPLPDEGALAGSGSLARRAPAEGAAAGDLRRRHAERAALADPQVVEPRADEPGHAPRRRPPPPRPLGRRAREPPLRRRRRGARVPRRVRLARRERPAAAPAARADLRRRAAVPARVGDDRERRRARAGADRRARDRRRPRHVGASRARGRHLEPAASRRRARPARERARRCGAAPFPAHLAGPADDLLREEPQGRRAHPPLRVRAPRQRRRRAGSRRTAPGTRPSSDARSSGGSSRASSSA